MRASFWSTAGEIDRLVGDASGSNPSSYASCIQTATVEAPSIQVSVIAVHETPTEVVLCSIPVAG